MAKNTKPEDDFADPATGGAPVVLPDAEQPVDVEATVAAAVAAAVAAEQENAKEAVDAAVAAERKKAETTAKSAATKAANKADADAMEMGATLTTKAKKVKIILEENDNIPPGGQFFGVNGVGYLIQPGVEVEVPEFILGVLNTAVASKPLLNEDGQVVGTREVPRFPYRKIG